MTHISIRPITAWPGSTTRDRKTSPFASTFAETENLLAAELDAIGSKDAIVELALSDKDFLGDGIMRTTARPVHPGVVLLCSSRYGTLRFFTDRYEAPVHKTDQIGLGWQHNLRAIVATLEALRKLERFGVASEGQQYAGWLQDGIYVGPDHLRTTAEAIAFLSEKAACVLTEHDTEGLRAAWRAAVKHLHPDRGGDPEQFRLLMEAKTILGIT